MLPVHVLFFLTHVPFKSSMFNLTGKITGKKYTFSVSSLPAAKPIPRDRAPDWVEMEQTSMSQALIYRLSGDYNPLHVGTRLFIPDRLSERADGPKDPGPGRIVILHGLATLGFTARALVRMVGHGKPSSLRYLNVRFTAPVVPGDGLETSAWNVGAGPDGVREVVFEVKNTRTGKVCFPLLQRLLSLSLIYHDLGT